MEDGAEMEQCATPDRGESGDGEPHASSEGVCANNYVLEQDKTFTESDTMNTESTSTPTRDDDAMYVRSEELRAVETTNQCCLVSPLQQLDPSQLVQSVEDVQHMDACAKDSNSR